jgi:hypothetical protein
MAQHSFKKCQLAGFETRLSNHLSHPVNSTRGQWHLQCAGYCVCEPASSPLAIRESWRDGFKLNYSINSLSLIDRCGVPHILSPYRSIHRFAVCVGVDDCEPDILLSTYHPALSHLFAGVLHCQHYGVDTGITE